MKSILFTTTLILASVKALKTETLLKNNFDTVFGDSTVVDDNAAVEEAGSSAFVIDDAGYLYEVDDALLDADSLNMAYAAPSTATDSTILNEPELKDQKATVTTTYYS